MATVIGGMTVSLDGFVEDRDGSVERLYPDLESLRDTPYMQAIVDQTGAVLMGRRTFAMGDPDWYAGNYEFQAPIFVLTSRPPDKHPKEGGGLTFTFVTDGLESAVAQASAAAGAKAVTVVGGPTVVQALLRAGLVDVLQVDVMPLLLGDGRRLFEGSDLDGVRLEKIGAEEVGARTSLSYRVLKP